MKRIIAILCVTLLLFSLCACGKDSDKAAAQNPDAPYTDEFQASAETNYEDVSLKVRTSSAVYFPGSIISITAVVSNDSDYYYRISPEGFVIELTVDGYRIAEFETVSDSDFFSELVVEPHDSVSITREYKTKVWYGEELLPLWECEPTAVVTVRMGKPAQSKADALLSDVYDEKTTSISFEVAGTGEKPQS